MTAQKQKNLLMRHLFLITSAFVLICCLLIVGFGLSSLFNDTAVVDIFPGKNSPSILLWRMIFYCAILIFWKPLTDYLAKRFNRSKTGKGPEKFTRYRIRLLILMLLYEVIVVQNVCGHLIGVFY